MFPLLRLLVVGYLSVCTQVGMMKGVVAEKLKEMAAARHKGKSKHPHTDVLL